MSTMPAKISHENKIKEIIENKIFPIVSQSFKSSTSNFSNIKPRN